MKDLLLCNAEVVADGATLEGQGAGGGAGDWNGAN